MKEVIVYIIVAFVSLFMSGYSIHMLVGGLVSPDTEKNIIIAATLIGIAVLAYIARDIARRRKGHQPLPRKG